MSGCEVLRTPEERFAGLPGFGYPPRYTEAGGLRLAYVEAGPPDGQPVLLLHGEPSWSYLYRKMLPVLAGAGLRAIAPDMAGFGRSDKPAAISDHSYARHVEWIRALAFDQLGLRGVTLVGQDWGGLIGLRLVAEHPERFARVVAANTGLPTGDQPMPDVWLRFRDVVAAAPALSVSRLVQSGCQSPLPAAVLAAYDAPFPDESYMAGRGPCPAWCRPPPTTRPARPTGRPGSGWPPGTGPSWWRSATATRSPARWARCSAARCPARPGSSTRCSREPATSCRRTRANGSPG